jgi:hypothetical protein
VARAHGVDRASPSDIRPIVKEAAMKLAPLPPLALATALCACSSASSSPEADPTRMSFFITSAGPGNGANLGGLAGADAHCRTLAEAAGVTGATWRAYLSTNASGAQPGVNARDRIGSGPWYNSKGVLVARDVAHLHSDSTRLDKQTALTEKGQVVNGRGDAPNTHDMLTGSRLDGTAFPGTGDLTCANWTSATTGSAQLGHHDRQGGGDNPTSWNSAHASRGCSQPDLVATGGAGLFYCFAI